MRCLVLDWLINVILHTVFVSPTTACLAAEYAVAGLSDQMPTTPYIEEILTIVPRPSRNPRDLRTLG